MNTSSGNRADNQTDNQIASGFQFDEPTLALLRKGDESSRELVAREIVKYFDALTRHVQSKLGYALDWHECKDVAQEFIVKFFLGKLARYEDKSAKEFSRIFYSALDNHAKDWLDKVVKTKTGHENQKRLEQPLPGGEGTFGDTLPDKKSLIEQLRPEELKNLVADIKAAMLQHSGGDELKAWVLEACLMKGLKADEISKIISIKFPGKVFASGSVYALVSHFRSGPELAAVIQKWTAGELWVKKR